MFIFSRWFGVYCLELRDQIGILGEHIPTRNGLSKHPHYCYCYCYCTTTTTTTAVHFSRRARTSRSAGQVPSDIIGEATHTQAQIPPKASRKKAISHTKAPATTESSVKPVYFSRRAPTKRTAKPKQVDAPVTKPETCTSLPPSQIPRLTTASIIQYEHQPSSKLSLNSRIFISPRMTKAKPQVDLQNSQSSACEQTFPIHGSVGSALIEDEESIYIDILHKGSTGTDAIAAVVLSGGVGGFCLNSYTWVDDVIPPGMVTDAECIGDNLDPIGICTDMDHRHGPPKQHYDGYWCCVVEWGW
ncbi:hypothetical protein BASA50_010495 [Batrachochytrium salamandrivorans]|uniref:Uncharacterized protein n=1 Tax=Batrachochytrium salamandrivorans TaxID=1357716 RepID=A0ABQ8EYD7_9FUNG|nr:hypothetical protein BASA50_010495 [Batrachochytrium salamandrivorans]